MADAWNARCQTHCTQQLQTLAICHRDGRVFGVSNSAKLPLTHEELVKILPNLDAQSLVFNDMKFILVNKESDCRVFKKGESSFLVLPLNDLYFISLLENSNKGDTVQAMEHLIKVAQAYKDFKA